jgi:hypothetical protein
MLVLNKRTTNTELKKAYIRELYNCIDEMFLPLVKLLNVKTYELRFFNTHKTIKALLLDLLNDDSVVGFSYCIYGSTISIDISIKN